MAGEIIVRSLEGVGRAIFPFVDRWFRYKENQLVLQGRTIEIQEKKVHIAGRVVYAVDYALRTVVAAGVSGALGITAVRTCEITRWSWDDTSAGCSAVNGVGVILLGISAANLGGSVIVSLLTKPKDD